MLLSCLFQQLLEPCTDLVVSVPDEYLGSVLSDLTSLRRAQVREVAVAKDTRVVHALVPLAALLVSTLPHQLYFYKMSLFQELALLQYAI